MNRQTDGRTDTQTDEWMDGRDLSREGSSMRRRGTRKESDSSEPTGERKSRSSERCESNPSFTAASAGEPTGSQASERERASECSSEQSLIFS